MRLFTSGLVVVMLALPEPAFGQTTFKDLAGTWVYRRDGGGWSDSLKGQLVVTYLEIEPNGTFAYEGKIHKNGEWRAYGVGWAKGSWSLAADTLRFDDKRNPAASYKVVLKDGRLVLWDWLMWDANRRDEKCAQQVFERFDASTPLTLPPPPQITIQPADLAGAWAGTFDSKEHGTVTDTLIIGADHSLAWRHWGWHPYSRTPSVHYWGSGSWQLLPGDELTADGILGKYRVYLHNGELVSCSPIRPVLKRVAP